MNSHRTMFTTALLLRLSLGALLLGHACLTLVALGVPGFGTALLAQGMPIPGRPAMLMELAAATVLILGIHVRAPGK